MNELLQRLQGGDLRSDGWANEVADDVLARPNRFDELFAGLWESDTVVRARTAHALERVSRDQPQLIAAQLPQLVAVAGKDSVPMVKWHLAMILANLVFLHEQTELIRASLLELLEDESVYVRCWSIAGLTILGKVYPDRCAEVLACLEPLCEDPSKAVSNRASKAVAALRHESAPIPRGWLKGQRGGGNS
jgi:hypothetical protein